MKEITAELDDQLDSQLHYLSENQLDIELRNKSRRQLYWQLHDQFQLYWQLQHQLRNIQK